MKIDILISEPVREDTALYLATKINNYIMRVDKILLCMRGIGLTSTASGEEGARAVGRLRRRRLC